MAETLPGSNAAPSRGRGLVISGAIITGISLAITLAAIVYFIDGMVRSAEAMSMVFPFLLLGWLALAIPTWTVGILLLGMGRQKQRGVVRGSTVAWIVAVGALPVIGFLLSSAMGAAMGGSSIVFYALIASIPLMIVLSIVAGAWLVWGKSASA